MYPSNIFKNKNLLHLYIIYISIKKFSFKHNSTQDKILFLTIFNSSPNIILKRFLSQVHFLFLSGTVCFHYPLHSISKLSKIFLSFNRKVCSSNNFPLTKLCLSNFVYHKFINQNEVVYNVFNFLFWPTKPPKTEGLTDERNGP